jgi:tRNA (guanine-N7-)-methyltransferase
LVGRRRDSLYGRRKGRTLSPRRAALLEAELPRRLVDIAVPPPADLGVLFPHRPQRIRLEIGFGGGEHLLARAAAEPGAGFIGIEPFVEGMAKAVAALAERDMGNVRLYGGDASEFLDWLPSASLDSVDLLYPDPWPKKRHWKRRFVSPGNLHRLARVLKPGSDFRFASDIPSYVEWTLVLVTRRPDFFWTAERASDWTEPFPGWPGTRYERKALAAGRRPTYLAFKRL